MANILESDIGLFYLQYIFPIQNGDPFNDVSKWKIGIFLGFSAALVLYTQRLIWFQWKLLE